MKRPRRAPVMTLQALEHWFDHATPPPPCRGVSTLNGFLTGLAAGPVFLTPNDWMWHVVGDHEDRAVIGNKVQAVIDTIVDHYNLICRQLASPGRYSPLLSTHPVSTAARGVGRRICSGGLSTSFALGLPVPG